MDRLFNARKKSPVELVKALKDNLTGLERLDKGDRKYDKTQEDIGKHLAGVKQILYGTGDQEPQTQQVAELAQEVYNANLLHQLIHSLGRVDFEAKKDVALVFNNLLRRQIGTRSPTVEYVVARPDIIITLMNGYEQPEIALTCGNMLRECVRHEPLARIVLQSEEFDNFFQYVEVSTFDVASDAFSTFKDIVTKHKTMCADYLDKNYDAFFTKYEKLLKSENYVTRRQSLKLLGELLLDRHNFTVMTRYIGDAENLKLMMNMLKERSKSIQFEAFHVFKVFVANPNKPRPIAEILLRNRERLVEFLTKFQTERTEDDQFNDEKAYLIKQINDMKPLTPLPPTGASDAAPKSLSTTATPSDADNRVST